MERSAVVGSPDIPRRVPHDARASDARESWLRRGTKWDPAGMGLDVNFSTRTGASLEMGHPSIVSTNQFFSCFLRKGRFRRSKPVRTPNRRTRPPDAPAFRLAKHM